MSIVQNLYRTQIDDTDSVKDPIALGLMMAVEPQVAVSWDLIPFGEPIRQLKYEVGDRQISAREVVLENALLTGDTDIDITTATAGRITDGHVLFHPATQQLIVLDEVNRSTGTCTFQSVLQQASGGSRTQINAGQTLYVLAQSEFYEEINAESRWEDTDKVTNYIQDTTELLKFSRADLREGRKFGINRQRLLDERMRDIMKDLNLGILYNVPQAPSASTKSALTAGIDYMIEAAGNIVDAAASGTAALSDIRGVCKTLQKNGVGPSDGLFALMSVNVFHAYLDEGLSEIELTTMEPSGDFKLGKILRGIVAPGVGDVPFFVDPNLNDDRVRFIAQRHISKSYYQGENGPLESPHVEDEPSLSLTKAPVSSFQLKWGTDIRNSSSVHYILDNTGLNS